MPGADWIEAFRAGLAECSAAPLRGVDWPGVEARLGHALPGDYRAVMERVGPGSFGDELALLPPEARRSRRSVVGNVGRTLALGSEIDWRARCFFMVDGNGNEVAWRREGPDPDRWPVEMFVHEEEETPVPWAASFRELLLAIASPEGPHHPGYGDRDQFLQGGRVRYVGYEP